MKEVLRKSKRGFKWTMMSNLVRGGLGFLTLLFLTYMLGAEQMGLISILTVVCGLSETFVQFGISQSIISRSQTTKDELSSIFWTNVAIGVFVFGVVFAGAPFIAVFYNQPEISFYIRTISLAFLLEPFGLVFRALLEKELEFPLLEKVNIIKASVTAIGTILLVLAGFGILGYVYGMIVGILISVILFMISSLKKKGWFPALHFQLSEIKEHYAFGAYVTGRSLLNYAGRNFDELIVGKFLGIEVLGLYFFAKKIIEKPASLLSGAVAKISFPLFAKLKEGGFGMAQTYLILSRVIFIIGAGIVGTVIISAPHVIPEFFDDTWAGSIFLVQIFALVSLVNLLASGFNTSILYIFNEPKYFFVINVVYTPIRLLFIFLASLISINFVAVTYLCLVLIKTIIAKMRVHRLLEIQFSHYVAELRSTFLSAVVSFLFAFLVTNILSVKDVTFIIAPPLLFFLMYGTLLFFKEKKAIKFLKRNMLW